ncbi:MAG: hypothetical protein AAGH73_12885 [Pseudomonadota bacterium]
MRGEMGFEGVVISDSLHMGGIQGARNPPSGWWRCPPPARRGARG